MPSPVVGSDDTVTILLPARGVLSMQFSVDGPITSRRVKSGSELDEVRDEQGEEPEEMEMESNSASRSGESEKTKKPKPVGARHTKPGA